MISYEIFAKFLFIVGQEDFRTHYTKKFWLETEFFNSRTRLKLVIRKHKDRIPLKKRKNVEHSPNRRERNH